jgi:Bacterial Ig-like domain
MRNQYWAGWMVLGSVGGLSLAGVTACGEGFGSTGCQASRTCVEPASGEAGEQGAVGQTTGDQPASGGSESGEPASTPEGGAPSASAGGAASAGTAGEPSAGGAAERPSGGAGGVADTRCHAAADCSNGNPADGEEICDPNGACQPGNPPPTVTAVSPADKSKNAEPETDVVLTFSEPLAPATITAKNVQVFSGTTQIAGTLKYADNKVTFTPTVPLFLFESFKVSVTTGVTDAAGAASLSPYSSTFATRDGAWKTIDAVTGSLDNLSDSLPISATGNTLLAWTVLAGAGCPASAAWFRHGAPNGATQAFDPNQTDCSAVTAGGNAAGVGAVAWLVPDLTGGDLVQQFRGGAWQAKNTSVSSDSTYGMYRVGVSATGMVTLIGQTGAGGTTAWHTDVSGKWAAKADTLSSDKAFSRASIAFDASGNGLAVWLAETATHQTEILSSRYTTASGKWSAASAIPDSTAASLNSYALDHAPSIAMTPDGDAMAVWIQGASDVGDHVNTSIFSRVSGWAADAFAIAPYLTGTGSDAPGVTYDGQAFVLAWVARPMDEKPGVCGDVVCTYTDRYDLKSAKWGSAAAQQTVETDAAMPRMPGLVSDGRGHLMLVWETKGKVSDTYAQVYQRFVGGKWSAIAVVPDGIVESVDLSTQPPALSMNASGMAALSWGNRASNNLVTTIRLASFY